ncbi:MAG: imidazole glycerol phosphate synthase subunit HisF [Hyphomicrobium sp.]|nr:MAG: imidazole glycerol phosphate synthase subunit HisF [Hyphomicrobium sp.]
MLRPRIIPCLLIHNNGLVKSLRFTDYKYVGDPINAVKIFNEKEADELIVLDIDATAEGREPNYKMIAHLANECRMPLCYGGGVKTAAQAKQLVRLGVEKVAVSSAAIEQPDLIPRIADEVGRQSCVVVLDVRQTAGGAYEVFTHNGRKATGREPVAFARELAKVGAGEIVVNSIDRDGVMKGYDVPLARRLKDSIDVPISVLGGAGTLDHVRELISACGVIGAAAGSMFVFKGSLRAVLINYPPESRKNEVFAAAG